MDKLELTVFSSDKEYESTTIKFQQNCLGITSMVKYYLKLDYGNVPVKYVLVHLQLTR